MMKIEDIKAGDTIVADGSFTCIPKDAQLVVQLSAEDGKYVKCASGRHCLSGQTDRHGNIVGFRLERKT